MQAAVACASKHLWWSSMWGGIFGEDGRYDAFATMMEILRVGLGRVGAPLSGRVGGCCPAGSAN